MSTRNSTACERSPASSGCGGGCGRETRRTWHKRESLTPQPRIMRRSNRSPTMRMYATRLLVSVCGVPLLGATLIAQAALSEIDTHINAARAAAGLDYRATFVNLCLPGGGPAPANPAAGRPGGAPQPAGRAAGGGRGPGGTPDRGTWYASPYK